MTNHHQDITFMLKELLKKTITLLTPLHHMLIKVANERKLD